MEQNEIKLSELINNIRQHILLIIILGFLVGGSAYGISSYIITPKYDSNTTMIVSSSKQNTDPNNPQAAVELSQINANKALISTYSEIVKSKGIADRVIANLGLDMDYEVFSEKVSIEPVKDAQIISVKVVDTIPERAQDIANETANIFKSSIGDIMNVDNVQILDGAESLVMSIYRNIDREKIQFDFAIHTNDRCDFDDEIESLGGRIYHLPRYKIYNHISYVKAWDDLLNKNEFQIIHGHMDSIASIYLKIAKKKNIPTIAHSHNISSGKGLKSFVKNMYHRGINDVSDYKFACSNYAGKWLFGNETSFEVIKNGIEVEKFLFDSEKRQEKRKQLGLKDSDIAIGHIGNYQYQKNHIFALKVFEKINSINDNYKFVFVGAGVGENLKKEVTTKKTLDNIIFLGSRSDVNELLQAFDIFILPSNDEGLGIVLIEAQAAGLQCYASNRIPQEVKISDNLKFLSIEGKDAIHRWVNEILDVREYTRRDMYKEIVKYGYDISITANKLEKFYCKLNNIERNI